MDINCKWVDYSWLAIVWLGKAESRQNQIELHANGHDHRHLTIHWQCVDFSNCALYWAWRGNFFTLKLFTAFGIRSSIQSHVDLATFLDKTPETAVEGFDLLRFILVQHHGGVSLLTTAVRFIERCWIVCLAQIPQLRIMTAIPSPH